MFRPVDDQSQGLCDDLNSLRTPRHRCEDTDESKLVLAPAETFLISASLHKDVGDRTLAFGVVANSSFTCGCLVTILSDRSLISVTERLHIPSRHEKIWIMYMLPDPEFCVAIMKSPKVSCIVFLSMDLVLALGDNLPEVLSLDFSDFEFKS